MPDATPHATNRDQSNLIRKHFDGDNRLAYHDLI